MYVAPNTDIVFCYDVPLDNTYEHTILFYDRNGCSGLTWQTYYFDHKWTGNGRRFNGQTYQDPDDNIIRVACSFADICYCNYMFFENKSHGPYGFINNNPTNPSQGQFVEQAKRFYCFVKKVKYVNENVTEVEFEVDVMQTYMFDYQLKECFIDREHSASDNDGENTVPEDLDCGTSLIINDHVDFNMNEDNKGMKVCILANSRPSGSSSVNGLTYNGIYSGASPIVRYYDSTTQEYKFLYADEYTHINDTIASFVPEDIVNIYQYPSKLHPSSYQGSEAYIDIPVCGLEFKSYESQGGASISYIAKNKKMKCYPYSRMLVSDNNGHIEEYKYELFYDYWTESSGGTIQYYYRFYFTGVVFSEPACVIYPKWYAGKSDNYDEAMVYSNFPQCSWTGDAFKSWWAQNKNQYQMAQLGTIIGGVMSTVANAATGNVGSAIMAPVNAGIAVDMQLAKRADIKNMPNGVRGTTQTNSISAALDKYKFSFYEMKIKPEFAIIIDQYFSRFGYKTNRIKVPNRRSRKYWCFTRTVNCAITETVGNDIAKKICSIYDNGITFWRYYDSKYNVHGSSYDLEPKVGEYSFYDWENEPLGIIGA